MSMVIFLGPGEVYFGDDTDTQIRTLLGSCVAVTLWHPKRKLGGMCHVAMPQRPSNVKVGDLDGRYADEAIQMLLDEMRAHHTQPKDYEVRVFGGGKMFDSVLDKPIWDIGGKNIQRVHELLRQYHMTPVEEDTGGTVHRHITLFLNDGKVVWRRGEERQVAM